ncbi:MAG: NAD(P)-dependent glycerol-3-phosphate dehydrogenase [Candidatus Latescibacteria bacterium]|nr:NAD(P)-dependent glycerol-3-phosphate dehydrogenase [Candidatus Latescibacterota bacterium]
MKITFVGAGRWAMTLALILHQKKNTIAMWEYAPERIEHINRTRKMPELPDSIEVPSDLIVTDELEQVFDNIDMIFFAVPSQVLRNVLITISPFRFANITNGKLPLIVSAMKGLENNTNKRMTQILKEFYPHLKIVVLSGPGIPYEIAAGKPASLVVASNDTNAAKLVQDALSTDLLRVYLQSDVIGTEFGGALKNVIAIAAGICDGLQLGDNAKAALITRGLIEMSRIGIAFNANPMTFAGLSGIGDLMVTAYSQYSRNRLFGEKVGQGLSSDEALALFNGVVEGFATTMTAKKLGAKMRLELPIIEEIADILYNHTDLTKSVKKLMQRPLKKEMIHEA